ncbi:hypothetical protein ASD07_20335 [Duganella sp. Root336D2]|nr:hypothetical protein ASD07_20335 [Duganella sp. Root336D2]
MINRYRSENMFIINGLYGQFAGWDVVYKKSLPGIFVDFRFCLILIRSRLRNWELPLLVK